MHLAVCCVHNEEYASLTCSGFQSPCPDTQASLVVLKRENDLLFEPLNSWQGISKTSPVLPSAANEHCITRQGLLVSRRCPRHPACFGLWPGLVRSNALNSLLDIYKLIPFIPMRKSSEPNDTAVVQYSNPVESSTSSRSHIIGGVATKSVFKMDPSEQYHRRPQTNCLPMNFQYTGSPVLPSQATQLRLSFDGLPRANPGQQFMNTWPTNIFSTNYNIPTSMPASQASTQWTNPSHLLADIDDQTSGGYYDYSPSHGNENNGGFQRSQNYADVPRTWPSQYEPRRAYDNSMVSKTYDASTYMIDPNMNNSQSTSGLPPGLSYDAQESSRDFARLSISRSPKIEEDAVDSATVSFDKSPGFMLNSRESSDDGGNSSREMTVADIEDQGTDEPYAKLIYRALMSAPNHSMVLQEIYQWFRENTSKGSSDTKGWMNSIRHNLSMNAVRKAQSCFESCS